MADFCKQCSQEMFGQDSEDLKGLCKRNEVVPALCEGCGSTMVDSEGTCLYHTQAGGTAKECFRDSQVWQVRADK